MIAARWPKGRVMTEWLTTRELGTLLGIKPNTVNNKILSGIYKRVKKGPGPGGQVWFVNIRDAAVPAEVRELYKLQFKRGEGRPIAAKEIRACRAAIEKGNALLRENNHLLRKVTRQ